MRKHQHAIQFDPALLEKLKEMAEKEKRSISNLVNRICQMYVDTHAQ